MFDQVRYGFALLWLLAFPVFLFWIAVHPFARFWRRMGPLLTYMVVLTGCAGLSVLLYRWRAPLLAVEFGTHPLLLFATLLFYVAAVGVETAARKHLTLRTLVGVPELKGEGGSERLLHEGIYARMRHPRYVGATLGYLASAFLANYLFLYAAAPLFLLLLHTIVLLEERELLDRFGGPYREYMIRVPRYVPRPLRSSFR